MSKPLTDYQNKSSIAMRELERRIHLRDIDESQILIDRAFFTKHYLRLLEEAFSANDLDNVRQTLIALERLYFGEKDLKAKEPTRKPKSKSNAPTT